MDDLLKSPENSIHRLDSNCVHRICTGQVILSLPGAVKELIENSLDADSSVIELKIKDHGLGSIEVTDNGTGIKEENFETLARSHCTSKINDFSQLSILKTFGFRGEALSALAALCKLSVFTRSKDSDVAFKLEFNHDGILISKSPCARAIGTTIIITDFFETLVVRRKEFEKNCKREFIKLCSIVYAYCIINYKVRFEFVHISNNRRQIVCSTHGKKCSTLKDAIVSVFGDKQFSSLVEIQNTERPNDEDLAIYNVKADNLKNLAFVFEGYVSGPRKELGRSVSDRQFVFINGRPCDYPKICKLANEIYREFNRSSQYPVFVVNIKVENVNVDINVTPDKRTIYVADENILLAYFRTALKKSLNYDAALFSLTNSSNFIHEQPMDTDDGLIFSDNVPQSISKASMLNSPENVQNFPVKNRDCSLTLKSDNATMSASSSNKKRRACIEKTNENVSTLDNFILTFHRPCPIDEIDDNVANCKKLDRMDGVALSLHRKLNVEQKRDLTLHCSQSPPLFEISTNAQEDVEEPDISNSLEMDSSPGFVSRQSQGPSMETDEIVAGVVRKVRKIDVDFQTLRMATVNNLETDDSCSPNFSDESGILIPINKTCNDAAENMLKKFVDKTSFKSMHVIGQFNAGFIIALQPSTKDLFIIDQHASDEKFNFELQQKNETIVGQRLVIPQMLSDWSSAELNVIADNLNVFRRNGFDFVIDNHSGDLFRVKLITMPATDKDPGDWKADLDYLIKFLIDFPGVICRPPSIRALFASRACRKSVMIGHILNFEQMRRIVLNMAEIDQPWNCPHGRPTMRHLFCVKGLLK